MAAYEPGLTSASEIKPGVRENMDIIFAFADQCEPQNIHTRQEIHLRKEKTLFFCEIVYEDCVGERLLVVDMDGAWILAGI